MKRALPALALLAGCLGYDSPDDLYRFPDDAVRSTHQTECATMTEIRTQDWAFLAVACWGISCADPAYTGGYCVYACVQGIEYGIPVMMWSGIDLPGHDAEHELEHESLHVNLWCRTGDPDRGHTSPEWAKGR